jgi:tetratricopeptide (TPR) repeat protein
MCLAGLDDSSNASRWRVFISHTSELREFPRGQSYVTAVERAISSAGHVTVDMADFPAADQPPAQVCVERVQGCDVYVGVLGTRYGSPVRNMPEVSYTELEFDTATEAGLPRLVFLLDTDADNVGIPLSALIDREFGDRQDAFRRRVSDGGLVQSFANPDQLRTLVERSLRELANTSRGGRGMPLGNVSRVWNIPARNPVFTGRDELLAAVHERLLADTKAAVQVLQGMGGVGKTQLAAEYAHRFAGNYGLAWWVDAEQPGLIGDQFAALGAALGRVRPGEDTEVVRATVLAELRGRGQWLLVFDSAEHPTDVRPWLPGGGGHVLITSRGRDWAEIAAPVEVDVLARAESIAILQARVAGLSETHADQLAVQLGDLPLAVAHAAGFMAETGIPAAQYLELLRTQAGHLLAQAAPGSSYPRSLAAATELIADRLDGEDRAAAQLASLCAFLAPEPIPEDLFTSVPGKLPDELAARAVDLLAWRQTLAHLVRQSLARIDQRGLVMHRLTQAILRDRLTLAQATATRGHTEAILAASNLRDQDDPVMWPRWAQLMPHLLAADLAATGNLDLRLMACNACSYLLRRGDTRTGYDLASNLREHWRGRLGDDNVYTLTATAYLARALRDMGRYADARDLDQDTLERRRQTLGPDHPDTLGSAIGLALDLRALGDVQAAHDLDQDILDRKRRVLGAEHPDTLNSANNLAIDLRVLGDVQAAHDLDQDTLDRRRRILGPDHPDTLGTANNLALALRALGDVQAAHDLDQDILDRKRRVLGADHPSTLNSANNLALDLRDLGDTQAAHDLDQDTLERRRRILGPDHPHTLSSASSLAADLRMLGEMQAAHDLDQDTLERRRRILGADHPQTLDSARNLTADRPPQGPADDDDDDDF